MQATIKKLQSAAPFETVGTSVVLASLDASSEATWRRVAEAFGSRCIGASSLGEALILIDSSVASVLVAHVDLDASPLEAAAVAQFASTRTVIALCENRSHVPLWHAIAWDAIAVGEEQPAELLGPALVKAAELAAREFVINEFRRRKGMLTADEAQVFDSVCDGRLNKQIASEVGVSVRTIEQRRRRVFEKMGVDSAVPLAAVTATVQTIAQQARRRRDAPMSGRSAPAPAFASLGVATPRAMAVGL